MNMAFDAADEIKALDINDPEWRDKVACIIKKVNHSSKLSTYHRMFLYLKHGPRKPRAFKKHVKLFANDFLQDKIETHENFSNRHYRKQIYGLFDWKKTP